MARLSVSRQTLYDWARGEYAPSAEYREALEAMLDGTDAPVSLTVSRDDALTAIGRFQALAGMARSMAVEADKAANELKGRVTPGSAVERVGAVAPRPAVKSKDRKPTPRSGQSG